MPVTVRRATKGDAARIAEFAVALFELHAESDSEQFTQIATIEGAMRFYGERSEDPTAAVVVAESGSGLVGFAYMQFEPMLYAELAVKALWLHDIYVDEEHRYSGAGAALIDEVRTIADGFGAEKILLSVAARNSAGAAFFERHGFRTTMHEMMLVV